MPERFELIVSNPPWINASITRGDDFELGNYDEDEQVVTSILRFAGRRLQKRGLEQKDGTLLLVYSDLSANLGLSSKSLIEDLCKANGLRIKGSQESFQKRKASALPWTRGKTPRLQASSTL